MAKAILQFPSGFLWGTATAAYQVEGNNTNSSWWSWEQEPGHILNNQKSGLACDWWGGRWKEDFDRAAETSQNAHRLSLEWSRIQLSPDRWDEHALDYYRDWLRGLVSRGIQPMVTLHHFSDPLWLVEMGGWENEATIDHFARFVSKVIPALQEYVSLWVTINEPNVFAFSGWVDGCFPPGKKDMSAAFKVMANLARAHAAGYKAIHALQSNARVGLAVNYRSIVPASRSPLDSAVARIQAGLFNNFFPFAASRGKLNYLYRKSSIPEAAHTLDFLGINYYTRDLVRFNLLLIGQACGRRFFPKDADLSENGFIANVPEGLFEALRWGRQFQVPLIVTENGVEDANDDLRPRYTAQHIHHLWRAVNASMPVLGYFHWSLIDNFEWERGWEQRFGLWGLDIQSQARQRRKSVDLYAAICRANALSSDQVAQYAPEVSEKIFPG